MDECGGWDDLSDANGQETSGGSYGWDELPEAEGDDDYDDGDEEEVSGETCGWDELSEAEGDDDYDDDVDDDDDDDTQLTLSLNQNDASVKLGLQRTVHFDPNIVTEVHILPCILAEDWSNLYYSCHELQRIRDEEYDV